MFNLLADVFQAGGSPRTAVLEVHPAQLSRWLDEVWGAGPAKSRCRRPAACTPFLGAPNIIPALDSPPPGAVSLAGPSGINPANPALSRPAGPGPGHAPDLAPPRLRLPAREHGRGGDLRRGDPPGGAWGRPWTSRDNQAVQWLRATEELFFRDPALLLDHRRHEPAPSRGAGGPPERLLADVRHGPRPSHRSARRPRTETARSGSSTRATA